jgi:pimeloyl-ACP methyl ester carboxylesterase
VIWKRVHSRNVALRLVVAAFAILCIGVGTWQLENERSDLSIAQLEIGRTPATVYRRNDGGKAPAVVIAHGFAGSRQLMEAYSLTLARAGYVAVAFDFAGHGRNPTPMTGDITRVDGTTQILMRELGNVIDAALTLPGVDGRVALLGHSMASDIIVREAITDPRVAATVAVSMFSEAVTASEPRDLLIVTGEWETFLRQNALRNIRLADPKATEGTTVGDLSRGIRRRAVVAPDVEHVSVLYSPSALREARAWLDAAFERRSNGPVSATGGPIVLLLLGIVLLAWPLSQLLPAGDTAASSLSLRTFLQASAVPALATPILLSFVDTHILPVLVADYLACHLLVYGLIALGVMLWSGIKLGRVAWLPALALTIYGIFVFGGALDRYVVSFWPISARLPIIAAIAVGAMPYMLADSLITEGGHAAVWRVIVTRGLFIASLAAAVALDFKRLFFLLIIIPVIAVFFTIFGSIGGWVGRRTDSPCAVGVGLGLILAWAIGVTFPMFAAG